MAVVLYNGETRRHATTELAGLAGKDALPGEGEAEQEKEKAKRKFAGERYERIDIGAHKPELLPQKNTKSLIMRTELMTKPAEADGIDRDTFRLLQAPEPK